jgi:hypothetical protein
MAELVQMGVIVAGLLLAAIGMVWLWRTSARPSIIERLERSMVSNQTRLDTQEGEIDDLRRQIVELREGRIADHALLQEWINYARGLAALLQEWIVYARRLAAMLAEATGKPPPPEPHAPPPPEPQTPPPPEPQTQRRDVAADGRRLANLILVRFSESEMRDLAAELGLEGHVSGDTAAEYAGKLVTVARQRGLLLRLVELCRRDRPHGGF